MHIGRFRLSSRVLLAPMAGITDLPFRRICRQLGAGLAAVEMLTSDVRLWSTSKSRRRMSFDGEPEPRVVQLAGSDARALAEAARRNVDLGAQIVDINMGCPAKKVCGRLCGSALLQDETQVERILDVVARAVDAPVTVKIRTGWDRSSRNGRVIARIAERCGVAAIAIHGRTRSDFFSGAAEYDTIREIKSEIRIPVIANGDIDSPQKAHEVLEFTRADGVMLGRAGCGAPWIFRTVNNFLSGASTIEPLSRGQARAIILAHLESLYAFYGEDAGVRIARKHLAWYCEPLPDAAEQRRRLMAMEGSARQFDSMRRSLDAWVEGTAIAA
jgi:tRNA-dihydrouridine synthase B